MHSIMSSNQDTMYAPDLKHRDWVLRSQQALIISIDSTISTKIVNTPDGGKRLILYNISESSIQNLLVLTNTDQNNNYLYLEDFSVTIQGDLQPLEFPGLRETMIKVHELSDSAAFINGSKTQKPFTTTAFKGQTINEYIDSSTASLAFVPSTYGLVKNYTLVYNPDYQETSTSRDGASAF